MTMKTIHKHELAINTESQTIELPINARILEFSFIRNNKALFIWVEVNADLNGEKEPRTFRVYKSGDGIPESHQFIASTVDQYFPESFHLYEIPS